MFLLPGIDCHNYDLVILNANPEGSGRCWRGVGPALFLLRIRGRRSLRQQLQQPLKLTIGANLDHQPRAPPFLRLTPVHIDRQYRSPIS